ncbi:MAG: hypothetical protein ACREK1_13545, partial [Longimicrobiales bacterium]
GHFSRGELAVLRSLLTVSDDGVRSRDGAAMDIDGIGAHGLSPREARELLAKLHARATPDFELDIARMRPPEEIEARMSAAVPKIDRQPAE